MPKTQNNDEHDQDAYAAGAIAARVESLEKNRDAVWSKLEAIDERTIQILLKLKGLDPVIIQCPACQAKIAALEAAATFARGYGKGAMIVLGLICSLVGSGIGATLLAVINKFVLKHP